MDTVIDWRALLVRYMAAVIDAESIAYIEQGGHDVALTESEKNLLLSIEPEARAMVNGEATTFAAAVAENNKRMAEYFNFPNSAERAKADQAAALFGVAFLVDGKYVPPESVAVIRGAEQQPAKDEEILALHRNLAAETLRADQIWQRYEEANRDRNSLRADMLRRQLSPMLSTGGEKPAGFATCPISGRAFWGNIDHPELGMIATYGGPFDTYSIPYLSDDDELRVERFDQDMGDWVEGGEPFGWFYSEQQPEYAAPAPAASVRPGGDPVKRLTHERDALGQAIADAAVKAGLYNGEVPLSGPHLIMFAQHLGDAAKLANGWLDATINETDNECRRKVAEALGLTPAKNVSYSWEYMLGIIKGLDKFHDEADSQSAAPVARAVSESEMLAAIEKKDKKIKRLKKKLKQEMRWTDELDKESNTLRIELMAMEKVLSGKVSLERELAGYLDIDCSTSAPDLSDMVWRVRALVESIPRITADGGRGALVKAVRDGVPLEEPVSVAKAMMAQEKVRPVLEPGIRPLAMVSLVNIQVAPWVHSPQTAAAYADGFNRGTEWLRAAIIDYADKMQRKKE